MEKTLWSLRFIQNYLSVLRVNGIVPFFIWIGIREVPCVKPVNVAYPVIARMRVHAIEKVTLM